jgi:hypothetical protein
MQFWQWDDEDKKQESNLELNGRMTTRVNMQKTRDREDIGRLSSQRCRINFLVRYLETEKTNWGKDRREDSNIKIESFNTRSWDRKSEARFIYLPEKSDIWSLPMQTKSRYWTGWGTTGSTFCRSSEVQFGWIVGTCSHIGHEDHHVRNPLKLFERMQRESAGYAIRYPASGFRTDFGSSFPRI